MNRLAIRKKVYHPGGVCTHLHIREAVIKAHPKMARDEGLKLTLEFIDEIINALCSEKIVKIHSFGTFHRVVKRGHRRTNFKTGAAIMVPSRDDIKFHPSDALIRAINK
jgi:nucleoid DNA-binding protein